MSTARTIAEIGRWIAEAEDEIAALMSQNDGELEGVTLQEFLTSAFTEVTHVQVAGVWHRFAGIGQNGQDNFSVAVIDPDGVISLEDMTYIKAVHAKPKPKPKPKPVPVLRGEVQR